MIWYIEIRHHMVHKTNLIGLFCHVSVKRDLVKRDLKNVSLKTGHLIVYRERKCIIWYSQSHLG